MERRRTDVRGFNLRQDAANRTRSRLVRPYQPDNMCVRNTHVFSAHICTRKKERRDDHTKEEMLYKEVTKLAEYRQALDIIAPTNAMILNLEWTNI